MAGLVETDQHGSRSRSGGRNHDSNRSRTTRKGAREREARKKLEAKRRTARPNFRPRLGSARHEGQAEAHAPWSGVIWEHRLPATTGWQPVLPRKMRSQLGERFAIL